MMQTLLNHRYQIIKKLGRGGFGTTYLAQDVQSSNSLCAIKKLNPYHADLAAAKRLFKREAAILSCLEIHQVPKFIDYFEEDSHSYIVEEYVKGQPLDDLLGKKWRTHKIIIFLWEMLSILQLLHKESIIHRDIKPANLIERERDRKIVLIDFGAVKKLETKYIPTHNNQVCHNGGGTCIYNPGYAPPEQIEGKPLLNSDLYALGMTAIQLLTGKHPRDLMRDDQDNIIWSEEFADSRYLTDILNKMVKPNFQSRYQSVEEVFKAMKEADEPTIILRTSQSANTSTATIPQPKKERQRPWYMPLVLGFIAIVGSEFISPWVRPWYYLYQGDRLLDTNQPEASLKEFQKVIDLKRDRAQAWKGRGDALFILGRYSGAKEAYQIAIALQPNNLKARNNLGKVLHKQGELQKALDTYQQVEEIDAYNAEAWSGQGLVYMGLHDYDQALESFERAQQIKPDEPTVWLQKGIVLKSLGRPEAAQQFYQEALHVYDEIPAKSQDDPLAWTDRGFVLLQLNRPSDAYHSYEQALLLNENFYEALLGKANALIMLNKPQEALVYLDKATKIRPQDYQVWYNRGNLLEQLLKNHQSAFTSFEKATQLKPDFYPAWLGQGLALTSLKRYQQALKAFDRAKDLNTQDPFLWVNRGLALEAINQYEEALNSYERAIELNFPPATEYRDSLLPKLGR